MRIRHSLGLILMFLSILLVNSTVGGQSIEDWGRSHYQEYGEKEGRSIPSSGNFRDYVQNYSDLLGAYSATISSESGNFEGDPMIRWGKSHYEAYGKSEGRVLPGNGSYRDYVRSYPDLLGAYNVTTRTASMHAQRFQNCLYMDPNLTCAETSGGNLSCSLVSNRQLSCLVTAGSTEVFNSCILVGREVSCSGNKGGSLRCKLIGGDVVCDYLSLR